MTTHQKTDEDFVQAIRDAVNRLQTACTEAVRHGLLIDMDIEGDEDDDRIPVIACNIYREWEA